MTTPVAWVAWEDRPHPEKPKARVRFYVWRRPGLWTTTKKDALTYPTKKEALAAMADLPRRIGTKKGADRL